MNIVLLVLIFLFALPNLWGIWHAFFHTFDTPQERFLWMGICVFVPLFGSLLYLLFGLRRVRGKLGA